MNAAKQAILNRLNIMRDKLTTLEDLARFVTTRANDLLLTPPRPSSVEDPAVDLDRLFKEFVSKEEQTVCEQMTVENRLRDILRRTIIERPSLRGRIDADREVRLPEIGRTFKANFAYNNGSQNLVRSEVFSIHEGHAIHQAESLGFEGFLVQSARHASGGKKQVIIIPDSENPQY